jgi:1-deoxy-D-xylulose-5-phosphate reductoisomerase
MLKPAIKRVAVLGSTGSIGINTLKVIEAFPDRFRVVGLSSFSNTTILKKQIKKFRPSMVGVVDSKSALSIRESFPHKGVKVFPGMEGLDKIAESKEADIIVIATAGSGAVYPLIKAIKAGKHICLANKESLVTAGSIIMQLVKKHGVSLIPIDSEHSAIFQCICSGNAAEIFRLFITGSGGSLHNISRNKFSAIDIKQVLNHPKWKMGKKITVDSATLMNKGLEIIEAHHLFAMPIDRIKLLIHPEAAIHSMCEFADGSIIAQIGVTDMKLPIQYALSYPQRLDTPFNRFDFSGINSFSFIQPDLEKYPCFSLAMAAAKLGGTATAVLNAADEIAVGSFLQKKLNFTKIPFIIEEVLKGHKYIESPSLGEILEADLWARERARVLVNTKANRIH